MPRGFKGSAVPTLKPVPGRVRLKYAHDDERRDVGLALGEFIGIINQGLKMVAEFKVSAKI